MDEEYTRPCLLVATRVLPALFHPVSPGLEGDSIGLLGGGSYIRPWATPKAIFNQSSAYLSGGVVPRLHPIHKPGTALHRRRAGGPGECLAGGPIRGVPICFRNSP